jgi:hypothetical protein
MGATNPTLDRSPARASDPAKNGIAFTGTADVTLTTYSRGVYIAADGDLTVDFIGDGIVAAGTNITFTGVKQGTILPICVKKIYDVGTTVSGVVLL